MLRELSLHPVHLTPDKEGNLPPSALVPFCAFQGNNSLLGQERPELDNLSICNKFKPTILKGQFCYSLDITKVERTKTRIGKAGGFFFLIDPSPSQKGYDKTHPTQDTQPFKIYISTLGQYKIIEGGAYAMRTLKQMTAKTSFANLPMAKTRCQVHNIVECQNKKHLDQVKSRCNCIPWALMTNKTGKVCSPEKESCVADQALSDESCLVPCTGLYADITEEHFLQQLRRQFSNPTETESEENRLNSIKETYNKYKKDYMKQLWFDPEKDDFSECISPKPHLNNIFSAGSADGDTPLATVYIYFGTETYDRYERDVKVTLKATLCQ